MEYLKSYESHEELRKGLQSLSDKMSRLNTLVKMERRNKTPNEIYEDYFLEFKEAEKFYVDVHGSYKSGVGPIEILMYKLIDEDKVESELQRYINKLKSIQNRIENQSYECFFAIFLNGLLQADLDPKTHKNDDYKFKGIGDSKFGYDHRGVCYSTNPSLATTLDFPDGKVSMKIKFFIV